jgi:hypothetical protein
MEGHLPGEKIRLLQTHCEFMKKGKEMLCFREAGLRLRLQQARSELIPFL